MSIDSGSSSTALMVVSKNTQNAVGLYLLSYGTNQYTNSVTTIIEREYITVVSTDAGIFMVTNSGSVIYAINVIPLIAGKTVTFENVEEES